MSFNFSWPTFSRQFHTDAARMLDAALNRGPKPKVIADDIRVEDINMGSIPPELEILEIGELSSERLRGIFRLTYTGDAHLLLSTKVQANPLTRSETAGTSTPFEDVSSAFPSSTTSRGILFAARPLVVPMQLRLSCMRLKAIIVLVVSKQKGITLVFKNDPLESVEVSSTFDSVEVIQKYLQQEIEDQLREMFREDLPGIIHRLSQSWLSSHNRKQSAAVGTASSSKSAAGSASRNTLSSSASRSPELEQSNELPDPGPSRKARSMASAPASHSHGKGRSPARRRKSDRTSAAAAAALVSPPSSPLTQRPSSAINTPKASRTRSEKGGRNAGKMVTPVSSPSKTRTAAASVSSSNNVFADTSFASSGSPGGVANDVENYDPTYGLRPNEVRMHGNAEIFKGFAMLSARSTRGFGDFATLSSTPEKDKEKVRMPASASVPSMLDLTRDAAGTGEDEVQDEDIEEVGGGEQEPDQRHLHRREERDVDDVDDLSFEEEDSEDGTEGSGISDEDDEGEQDSDGSTEEEEDVTIEESMPQIPTSLDFSSGLSRRRKSGSVRNMRTVSSTSSSKQKSVAGGGGAGVEYEMIPAVGGGMATRPRVYHIASRVQAPDVEEEDDLASAVHAMSSVAASSTARGPASSRAMTVRPRRSYDNIPDDGRGSGGQNAATYDEDGGRDYSTDESPSAAGHESLATLDPVEMDPASIAYRTQLYRQQYGGLYRPGYGRNSSTGSAGGVSSAASSSRRPSRSPDEDFAVRSGRAPLPPGSRASTAPTSLHLSSHDARNGGGGKYLVSRGITPDHDGAQTGATLSPSNSNPAMTVNASNHFMDLVNSNHTLSPFTRTLDTKGYAVRSHPVTPTTPSVASANTGSVASGRSGGGGGGAGKGSYRMQARMKDLRLEGDAASFSSTGSGSGSGSGHLGSSARPAAAGRRRTFKLASSKSAGNTPSTAPGTPVEEWQGGGAGGVQDYRNWRPSAAGRAASYAAATSSEREPSDHGHRPKLTATQSSGSASGLSRRNSYDRRRFGPGSGAASLVGGESEYSAGGGVRTMGSILE